MTRVIKFRAWNTKQGRMYSVDLERLAQYIELGYPVMQFTGLTDKNGKEIYEGDVLQTKPYGKQVREMWKVEYVPEKGAYCYKARNGITNPLTHAFSVARELEVIGNIYENPDIIN